MEINEMINDELDSLKSEFQFHSIHPITPKGNIVGLLGYYTHGTNTVWDNNDELTIPTKLGYIQSILFLSLVIDYDIQFDTYCYLIAAKIGKYKIPQLKKYEEKIKAYVAEHPEK